MLYRLQFLNFVVFFFSLRTNFLWILSCYSLKCITYWAALPNMLICETQMSEKLKAKHIENIKNFVE